MIAEILLTGLAIVGIYVLAHQITMTIERRAEAGLQGWRSAVFFVVFLGLLLAAMGVREWWLAGS